MKKEDLKIIFFGTPDFAVASLDAILRNGFNVCAVVTATDKVAGRGHKMQSSAVKKYALDKGLDILQPEKLKDEEFINALKSYNADLFIVIAFRMLPKIVWDMPGLGTFNLHASLLPKYRGAAPINHAVINGETLTGVTTFFLSEEIDTGDIIEREEIIIDEEDNAGTLHDKLMHIGAELTVKTINNIVENKLVTHPQSKFIEQGIESCGAPKIFKETGNIDWDKPAKEIHNLIRGLSPYPGAWSTLYSETTAPTEVKIFKSKLTDKPVNNLAGTVVINNGTMYVACSDFYLELLEIQPSGKRRMDVADYLRGARLHLPVFKKI